MFVLYALLVTFAFTAIDLIYTKMFQLENYKIKNYFFKIINLQFAIGKKNCLVLTNRAKRLIFCEFLTNFLIFLLFFAFFLNFWMFLIIFLCLIFSPFLVILAFFLAQPIEELIKRNYINKAKKKLQKMPCKKIAITGSFGKTSTKNILYQILKEEFDVCSTPKSYNTPMGICKTILHELKETDDFFIVEFGARQKGDIEFLAKFVGVDFGIITPIGNCHLETFGSLENIENEKYKLCLEAKNVVVFNGRSKSTQKLFQRFHHKKYLVCQSGSFAYAENIKYNENGSTFDLVLAGEKHKIQTTLLGKANIDNIVVGVAMAHLLGESFFNIKKALSKLKGVPHRLELIKGEFVNVIDDSYNSNFEGFNQALDVLKFFNGKKIVISPGIVELGKEQFQTNFEAGKNVSRVADVFVIMNETNKDALKKGAISGGMSENQLYFANTRQKQKEILKEIVQQGDVVLFENDLPDNFA